jgi:outer membrane protein assembly factor BamB
MTVCPDVSPQAFLNQAAHPMTTLTKRFLPLLAVTCGLVSAGLAGADCHCETAADEFAAENAGLEREWMIQLPFDASIARVEHVVIGDRLVVAQTGDGNVHAVQAAAGGEAAPRMGTLLWTHSIGQSGGPLLPAGIGRDLVTVAHEKEIYAIEATTGQRRWHERLGHLSQAGSANSGAWVYLPVGSEGIVRLPANPYRAGALPTKTTKADKKKPAKGAARQKEAKGTAKPSTESLLPLTIASGGIVHDQPQPYRGGVLWHTASGKLVSIEPGDTGWQRNEFLLEREMVGRPLVHDEAIFAATADGNLVRIDPLDRPGGGPRLTWRVLLDAQPEPNLFLSGDHLVVSLGEEGLAVYSAATGELIGRTWVPGQIVSVCGGRIWLFDRVGRLSSIDLATGERRDRICLGNFTFPVVNQTTERLILASPNGVLVSLKPVEPDAAQEKPAKAQTNE